MGEITIEIPQELNRKYRLVSESSARKVLSNLERLVKKENSVEDDEILGLWAGREESVEAIARKLRRG
jgi:pyruvate-formate lyase-activating enzyme